jgi:hypothetical protein
MVAASDVSVDPEIWRLPALHLHIFLNSSRNVFLRPGEVSLWYVSIQEITAGLILMPFQSLSS